MQTITHLYDRHEDAAIAVRKLTSLGIPASDISIVARNEDGSTTNRTGDGDETSSTASGVGIGATLGGAAGLLAGIGIMAIPGLGPVVAAGWLASTAAGAAAGGATGGIIGALVDSGVSDDDANTYAEGVRRGGTLVSVRVDEMTRAAAESALMEGSVDIGARAGDYRASGWSRFDQNAPDGRRPRDPNVGL